MDETDGGTREKVEERVRGAAGTGLDRAADAAHRAGDWAHHKGGAAAHAEGAVHGTASSLEHAADYVRRRDMDDMRGDLAREVREHPLRSLMVAALSGYLLGKIFG